MNDEKIVFFSGTWCSLEIYNNAIELPIPTLFVSLSAQMYEKSIERDHFQKRTDTAVKIATTKFELMEEERERENLLGVISERLSCKYDDDDKQDVCVIAK